MSNPTLALEQAQDLRITAGSSEVTYDAVATGADLSLYMTTEWYEETLHFQQMYVGDDGYFAGIMTNMAPNRRARQMADQPFVNFFRYDTSGTYAHVKWHLDGRTERVSQSYPYGVYRWYVGEPWRTIYEHDEDGKPRSGSLGALMGAVRQGHRMRVAIRNLFGLDEPALAGPPHWVIVDLAQPCVAEGHVAGVTEPILVMAGIRPLEFSHPYFPGYAMPRTTGVLDMYLSSPELKLGRVIVNRAMRWMIQE